MDAATLYLMYIAATGGPEKRAITHFESTTECTDAMARWQHEARKTGRYKVTKATCLTPAEYNAMTGVFTSDTLDQKHRP